MVRQIILIITSIVLHFYSYLVYDFSNLLLESIKGIIYIVILLDLFNYCKNKHSLNLIFPISILVLNSMINVISSLVFGISTAETNFLLPIGFVLLLAGSIWLGIKLWKNAALQILGISFIVIPLLLLFLVFFSEYYGIQELELIAVTLESVSWVILLIHFFKSEIQERG